MAERVIIMWALNSNQPPHSIHKPKKHWKGHASNFVNPDDIHEQVLLPFNVM